MPATMSTEQVTRQIRHMAALATVNVGGGQAIFAPRSIIAPGQRVNETVLPDLVFPVLLVQFRGFTAPYSNCRVIHRSTFEVVIIVDNPLDPYGQAGMLGHARADSTTAVGMGCLGIFDELDRESGAFRQTGSDAGLGLTAFTPSSNGPEDFNLGGLKLQGLRCTLEVIHANDTGEYQRPKAFTAADAGSGNATLTWTNPGARFDNGGVYIRYAAGATAPATTSSGTELNTYDRDDSPVTHAAGVGQISYSIWGAYDPDTHVDPGSYPTTANSTTYSASKQTATVTVT